MAALLEAVFNVCAHSVADPASGTSERALIAGDGRGAIDRDRRGGRWRTVLTLDVRGCGDGPSTTTDAARGPDGRAPLGALSLLAACGAAATPTDASGRVGHRASRRTRLSLWGKIYVATRLGAMQALPIMGTLGVRFLPIVEAEAAKGTTLFGLSLERLNELKTDALVWFSADGDPTTLANWGQLPAMRASQVYKLPAEIYNNNFGGYQLATRALAFLEEILAQIKAGVVDEATW